MCEYKMSTVENEKGKHGVAINNFHVNPPHTNSMKQINTICPLNAVASIGNPVYVTFVSLSSNQLWKYFNGPPIDQFIVQAIVIH